MSATVLTCGYACQMKQVNIKKAVCDSEFNKSVV